MFLHSSERHASGKVDAFDPVVRCRGEGEKVFVVEVFVVLWDVTFRV